MGYVSYRHRNATLLQVVPCVRANYGYFSPDLLKVLNTLCFYGVSNSPGLMASHYMVTVPVLEGCEVSNHFVKR